MRAPLTHVTNTGACENAVIDCNDLDGDGVLDDSCATYSCDANEDVLRKMHSLVTTVISAPTTCNPALKGAEACVHKPVYAMMTHVP